MISILKRKLKSNVVIVFAHSGTTRGMEILGSNHNSMSQDVFDRHLPYWEHHGWPVIVISHRDNPIKTKHELILCGDNEHAGVSGYRRIYAMLELLASRRHAFAIIHEWDSICLEPNPVLKLGYTGNIWPNRDPSRFIAYRYANFPWVIDHESAKAMFATMRRYPSIEEEGFHDRLLPALAEMSRVPLFGFGNLGMSNDTLLERDRDELSRKILNYRACWIHGIKSEGAFNVVINLWKQRK